MEEIRGYSPTGVEQGSNNIIWYHQNDNTQLIVNKLINKQQFDKFSTSINDITRNLIFGGMISGKGMVSDGEEQVKWQSWSGKAWHLKSQHPANHF